MSQTNNLKLVITCSEDSNVTIIPGKIPMEVEIIPFQRAITCSLPFEKIKQYASKKPQYRRTPKS